MADGNPHDRLFKGVFGDPRRGFAHLRGLLPARLAGALDPGTVRTMSGSYVDSRLRTRESDLLFQVQLAGSPMLVYLLFEHQSRADPRLLCRLQRYLARIWETWERQHPETVQLPLVVPCVLYHGPGAWPGPRRFREALAAPAAVLEQLGPYIPDFGVLLEDLSAVPDEKLKEQALTQLTLLVLKHGRAPDFASTLPRLKRPAGLEPPDRCRAGALLARSRRRARAGPRRGAPARLALHLPPGRGGPAPRVRTTLHSAARCRASSGYFPRQYSTATFDCNWLARWTTEVGDESCRWVVRFAGVADCLRK